MLRALLASAAGGLALAAPVPKAPPPPAPKAAANLTLGTATLNGPLLRITYDAPPLGAAAGPIAPNPAVIRPPAARTLSVSLGTVTVTTADGTELTADELAKRLADGAAVARSYTPIDPEWKKLFADDVLFIEPSGKPAAAVGGPVAPGGVIRPLPVRPLPVRPPLPPVEDPPVEKKGEKREEKNEEKK